MSTKYTKSSINTKLRHNAKLIFHFPISLSPSPSQVKLLSWLSLISFSLTVLSIECLNGTSSVDEEIGDFLQTGDIIEEFRIGNSGWSKLVYKKGKGGVQKTLHESFKKKETSILVQVRRGVDEFAELQACIVPNDLVSQKKVTCLGPSLNSALSPFGFSLYQRRAKQGTDLQGFNNGCHWFLIQRKWWETFEFLDLMFLIGFEIFGVLVCFSFGYLTWSLSTIHFLSLTIQPI